MWCELYDMRDITNKPWVYIYVIIHDNTYNKSEGVNLVRGVDVRAIDCQLDSHLLALLQ